MGKKDGTHRLTSLSLLALGSLCALRLETLGCCVLLAKHNVLHAKQADPFLVNERDLQDWRGYQNSCHPKIEREKERKVRTKEGGERVLCV